MSKKYEGVRLFWEYQNQGSRLQYLRDWGIYRTKGIHSLCPTMDWDDLTEFEKETIHKAHRKAVNDDN